jgi:hypothetical protein
VKREIYVLEVNGHAVGLVDEKSIQKACATFLHIARGEVRHFRPTLGCVPHVVVRMASAAEAAQWKQTKREAEDFGVLPFVDRHGVITECEKWYWPFEEALALVGPALAGWLSRPAPRLFMVSKDGEKLTAASSAPRQATEEERTPVRESLTLPDQLVRSDRELGIVGPSPGKRDVGA